MTTRLTPTERLRIQRAEAEEHSRGLELAMNSLRAKLAAAEAVVRYVLELDDAPLSDAAKAWLASVSPPADGEEP